MITATKEELQAIEEILEKTRELAEKLERLDQIRYEAEFEEEFEKAIEEEYGTDDEDDCLIVRDDITVSDSDDEYMTAYEEDPVLTDEEEREYEASIDEYLAELAGAQLVEDVMDAI